VSDAPRAGAAGRHAARPDVAIVGAGVIGLALAYELARRGRGVVVVDRGQPGGGATQAAGGMLAPVSEAERESPLLVRLGQDSLQRYPDFVREVERLAGARCGYRADGALWVALHRDDEAELERLGAALAEKGLGCRPLDARGVLDLEPHLSGRVTGGLLVEDDRQVDPRRLAACLARAVDALGGSLLAGVRVDDIREAAGGGALSVNGLDRDGARFVVEAPQVVLAAGAWSSRGVRLPLPLGELRPVKGQLVRLRGTCLLRRVVRTPRAYLVPREDGELLVGATLEEQGFDETPTAGAAMELLRGAWEVLPGVYELRFEGLSVGLRSAVDDHLPVIGAAGIAGLFLAFGHYRNGVLLAPATAHYLAEWLTGAPPPPELSAFGPERLARGAAGRPPHAA
jgi:glycine oxidase